MKTRIKISFLTGILLNISLLTPVFGAETSRPFWQTKEKVYERIKNGEIIVSVHSEENQTSAMIKSKLLVQGGGWVLAPLDFVYKEALKFDQLPKVSGYVTEARFDSATGILKLKWSAFGHQSEMALKLKLSGDNAVRKMDYVIISGPLEGFAGCFEFVSVSSDKTQVGMSGTLGYDRLPIPKIFLEFGLEVVFQKMASRLRGHVEDLYKKEVPHG